MSRLSVIGGASLGLLLVPAASAHVTASPSTVPDGGTAVVELVTPNERQGHATVQLTIDVPAELEIVSAQAPAGWLVERTARSANWSGGRLEGDSSAGFPLELRGIGPAGQVELVARQRYEDGTEVTWRPPLTVLPASGAATPNSHLGRALVAGIFGLLVVAGSLAIMQRLRKRTA